MLRYFLFAIVLLQTVVDADSTPAPTPMPGSGFDAVNKSVPNAIAISLTLLGTIAGMLIADK
jgi:hypothetical protein